MENKIKLKTSFATLVGCLLAASVHPASAVSASYRNSGINWDTVVSDANALGSVYITPLGGNRRAPEEGDTRRVASYRVTFSEAGTYDLYGRVMAEPGAQGSLIYYSGNFGAEDNWVAVNRNNLKEDAFVWVNLSEEPRSGRNTFTVDSPGTVRFSIATGRRDRGIKIDAFAFGTTGTTFTDEQLDASAVGNQAQPGLIGFQAEFAAAFGSDTISDEGLEIAETLMNRLVELRAELSQHIGQIDQARVATWQAAIKAEEDVAKEAAATANTLARMQAAEGNLKRLKEEQSLGPKTLEDARERLTQARARGDDDPELASAVESAESFLANRQKQIDGLERAVERARRAVEQAKKNLPEAIRAAEVAKQAHEAAMAATWSAMDALGTRQFLGSSHLDSMLVPYMVISAATPRELAKFAAQSPENAKAIHQLLGDTELMTQMLVADGPNSGRYGEAMKIYTDIQQASPRANEGVLQRLALAVSLGHAATIAMRERDASTGSINDENSDESSESSSDAEWTIDPVQRYLNYEKWYLNGELDRGFKDLCVWSLVMVVDGRDSDETLAWGREMLRNLRPDCIPINGDTSIYVDVVDNEIAYTAAMVKEDRPELQLMQNILANGGICGRRAFFGRFMLRAFGVPTTARSEPGHATLAHWHPDGWQVKLGGNWGPGNRGRYARMNRTRSSPYGVDLNFLASTQARQDADAYTRVKRAQWIATFVGEEPMPGLVTRDDSDEGKLSFWNELALHEQRRIIAELEAKRAGSSSLAQVEAPAPSATGQITVNGDGIITIPSAATSSPTESTANLSRGGIKDLLVFVKDPKSGVTRLHVSRYSSVNDEFTYTFNAPNAGKYQMVANVATPRWEQRLFASANGGPEVEMPLPYTIGLWEKTAPVEIELAAGRNELTFHGPARATIDHFKLTPVR